MEEFYTRKLSRFQKVDLTTNDSRAELAQAYGEVRFLAYSRANQLDMQPLKTSTESTPDFRLSIDGNEFNFEVKTLHYAGGEFGLMQEDLDTIDAFDKTRKQMEKVVGTSVEESAKRNKVFITEITGHPMGSSIDRTRQRYSIAHATLKKIRNNIKKSQFTRKNTFLVVDDLIFDIGLRSCDIKPIRTETEGQAISGMLWMMAFGKCGNIYFEPGEFEGKPNLGTYLTDEDIGILVDVRFDSVRGILWVNQMMNELNVYGLFRGNAFESDDAAAALLNQYWKSPEYLANDHENTGAFSKLYDH